MNLMRKQNRLCAVVLILTIILSAISPMYVGAESTTKSNDIRIPDSKTFVRKQDGDYIRYYGYTGDQTTSDDIDEDVTVVDSQDDYYSLFENSKANKDIAATSASTLPTSVDNSTSKFFPAIGDQGGLGSCTFWAQVYYQFTYMMNREMNVTTTADNTFSPQWAYNVVAGPNEMIGPYYDTFSFLRKQGAVFQSQVPYTGDPTSFSPTADVWETSINYRLKDYYKLDDIGTSENPITSPDDSDLTAIKTALANGELLTCSTYIYSWGITKLKTNSAAPENNKFAGQEVVVSPNGKDGAHRITIVGYNDNIWSDINENNRVDSGEMGAIKIANSWGDKWSNNGYIWIAYDAINETSCVENSPYTEKRPHIIGEVAGISVMKKGEDAQLYLRYTLNTADRTQVKLYLTAEKDGTIFEREVVSNETSGPKIAYDGSSNATDATMVSLLSNSVPGITSENFADYSFSVRFVDENNDSNPLIVKNAEIVDKNLNKVYKVNNVFPFTLDGSEKTVEYTKSDINHAVIYYRGYDTPSINYKLTNLEFLSTPVLMEKNLERRGYLYKYIIDLKDKSEAKLYFTDSAGIKDDNSGAYFTAKKGLNYYVTENIADPIKVKLTNEFDSFTDVNNLGSFSVQTSGGYAPYLYKYTLKNLDTGKEEVVDYSEMDTNGFYFREEGKYRMTVDVKDFADEVVSTYMDVEVKDLPFEFESLYSDSLTNVVGNEITFTAKTKYEKIRYTGKVNNEYTFEIKDSSNNTVFKNTKKGEKCNMNLRYTETTQKYTPHKTGVYTITVSSTDQNNEYAEMSYTFKVVDKTIGDTDASGDITVMDATNVQRYLVNLVEEPAICLELSDCDKSELVNIMDATYIQRYLAHADKTAFVGETIEYIPPTEVPTEKPTEKPTQAVNTNKVTFTNSFNWSGTIYCYYWSDENTAMTNWPGVAMKNAGTNEFSETLYTFDVPSGATYLIFTNGSAQTTDITYNGGEMRYYPISTTDSSGHNLVETW